MSEAQDVQMGGSDGSDDDSSSSGSDLLPDVSEGDMNLIMELEQRLQKTPREYNAHLQLIEVLRRCGMRERLREARRSMHALFPLSEALWFDWVADELEAVEGLQDIPRIVALFEVAVKDYLSVGLWSQYLEFVRDFDPEVQGRTPEGLQRIRDLFERALTACGLHIPEGSKIWKLYRDFEATLEAETPGEEAAERVRAMFHRELAVPLADAADALAAYQQWKQQHQDQDQPTAEDVVPSNVRRAYDAACAAVELRQPYETAVAAGRAADADLLAAYMGYIKVEESGGQPARVLLLFERALAIFPVTHFLWLQYARYIEAQVRSPQAVHDVYARAARNCPWVGEVWARALRALERSGGTDEAHAAMYAAAMAVGLQGPEDVTLVALARADALRRRGPQAWPQLREVFSRASALLRSSYPDHFDPSLQLTAYWAECALAMEESASSAKTARAVWEGAVKGAAGRHPQVWLGYAEMERRQGNVRECRAVYKRCYSRKMEGGTQAALCEAWLRFEREHGSAEDHLAACLKAEPILAAVAAAAAAAANAAHAQVGHTAAEAAPKAKINKEEFKAKRQQADPNFKRRQREATEQAMAPPPAKRPRSDDAAEPPKEQQAQQQAQQPPPFDDSLTVFVKHLPLDADQAAVEELFAACGEGFAYVDMATAEGFQKACALNATEFRDKTLFVAPSKPPAQGEPAGGGRGGSMGARGMGRQADRGGRGAGPRGVLDLPPASGAAARAPPPRVAAFMPRAAALQKKGAGAGGATPSGEGPLKSNEEFRKMMLGKGGQ